MEWSFTQIVLVICYGIGFCLCIFLILSAIHYIWILQNNPPQLKRIKVYSFWAISLFAITCLIRLFEITFYHDVDPLHHQIKGLLESASLLFWSLAQSCSYILFIQRFKMIFDNTEKYEYNSKILILLYIEIFLFVLIEIINIITAQLYYQDIIENESLFLLIDGVNNIIASFMDLVLTVMFIYLFTRKLLDLTVDVALNNSNWKSSIHSINSAKISSLISLNTDQMSIVHIVAKCSILSSIAVISTQIFFFYYNVLYVTYQITKSAARYDIMFDIYLVLWWFAIMMNVVTIFLNLDATFVWYQFFCLRVHKLCQQCCEKLAKKKLQKNKLRKRFGSDMSGNLLICDGMSSNYGSQYRSKLSEILSGSDDNDMNINSKS